MNIEVLNLGIGNVQSVVNWVDNSGFDHEIQSGIEDYDHKNNILVIPGVANSIELMRAINKKKKLREKLKGKLYKRIVGICAGFHVLTNYIYEGENEISGLGLINAKTINMHSYRTGGGEIDFEIDHVMNIRDKVYYNHGCGVYLSSNKNKRVDYVFQERVVGLQFHPEKSGRYGIIIGKEIFSV